MSWDHGEGAGQRRRSTPLVVVGVVVALVLVGFVVRQDRGAESEQLTVDPSPSRPRPTVEQAVPDRPVPPPSVLEQGRIEPLLLGSTGLTLHAVDTAGRLLRVDFDSGVLVEVDLLGDSVDQIGLVADGRGGVVVVPASYELSEQVQNAVHVAAIDAQPVALGEAAEALSSARPGHVWLLSQPTYFSGGLTRVREVAYDGTVAAEATLPAGVGVLAAVEGGLLVDAAGTLVLYDPAAGRGQALGAGRLVAADPRWVVRRICDAQLRCALAVGPVDNPYRTRVPLPGPTAAALDLLYTRPVLSPDGTRLALLAGQDPAEFEPRPALVDLTTGDLRQAPEEFPTGTASSGQGLAWAPSGEWLFTASNQIVLAWNLADDRVVSIDLGRSLAAIAVS